MKIIKQGIIGTVALILVSAGETFAVEGLQISVQCSNVVLSWPSIEWKNYIVQYRPTLDPSTPWTTITSSLPADIGTNLTFFVHSNAVLNPVCNGGGSFAPMMGGSSELDSISSAITPSEPMAMPLNGLGSAVPVSIYPPGFDFSNFVIFDPFAEEWVKGLGFTRLESYGVSQDGLDPNDPGEPQEGGGISGSVETGFYQVVMDGVQILDSSLTNLTNGVLSDTVNIGFEAGNSAQDGTGTNVVGKLEYAVLVVDGVKFAGENILSAPPGYLWRFAMDTAFLENGEHTLQVKVGWKNPDSGKRPYINRVSDPIAITVSNQIYYPNWEEEVGETDVSAYFAKTVFADADWSIDIYDIGTNFVQTLSGHTTDGIIEAYWNMVDTNGVARTNVNVDPVFSSIITVVPSTGFGPMGAGGSSSSKQTPNKKPRKKDWPDQGAWVVAYQDMFKYDWSQYGEMEGSIDEMALLGYRHGGVILYMPPQGATNVFAQTYPVRYQDPDHPDTNVTQIMWEHDYDLLGSFLVLTNSRNFYWNGHGDDTHIGEWIGTVFNSMGLRHRYRFVFLDACSTAKGSLDHVFGIKGPGRFALIYYHNTGIRPGAYVGYSEDVYYTIGGPQYHDGKLYDDQIPWEVPAFITNFIFYWELMGYPMNYAFNRAANDLPYVPGLPTQPGQNLTIYGYDELGVDDFNYRDATW